jgi:hypothetical protein
MVTLMLGTVILALTYGAFWHNQPARRQNDEREGQSSRLGGLVNRAMEWLLLIPHVPNPVETEERLVLTGRLVPARQTEFFRRVLRALRGLYPRGRNLADRSAGEASIPAELFEAEANTDPLATGRAA